MDDNNLGKPLCRSKGFRSKLFQTTKSLKHDLCLDDLLYMVMSYAYSYCYCSASYIAAVGIAFNVFSYDAVGAENQTHFLPLTPSGWVICYVTVIELKHRENKVERNRGNFSGEVTRGPSRPFDTSNIFLFYFFLNIKNKFNSNFFLLPFFKCRRLRFTMKRARV